MDLPPDVLDAFILMRERLIAEDALRQLDVLALANEWADPQVRQQRVRDWLAIARGDDPAQQDGPRYDEQGREILIGSGAVRDWLVRVGGFSPQQIGG